MVSYYSIRTVSYMLDNFQIILVVFLLLQCYKVYQLKLHGSVYQRL